MGSSSFYFKLHPAVKQALSREVDVRIERQSGLLKLTYEVRGSTESLWLPGQDPSPGAELWENTCFELFARLPGHLAYWEWNFNPLGPFNSYYFTNYRERARLKALPSTVLSQKWEPSKEALKLEVTVQAVAMPSLRWAFSHANSLEVSPTLILKTKKNDFEYWACQHPAEKPDFHDERNFSNLI